MTSSISGMRRSTGAVHGGASASMTTPRSFFRSRAKSGWASSASPIQFGAIMRIFATGPQWPLGLALGLLALVDVTCAAVRAEHLARFGDVEEHPWMQGPYRRLGRGAMQGKIRFGDLDDAARRLVRAHQAFSLDTLDGAFSLTGKSQSLCLATLPAITSKKNFWILVVTGPRVPAPIVRPSSSRLGVTSAAVPVKKASSAMRS